MVDVITLFVLLPFIALCMVINTIIACYVAIRLGYGPPHWVYALNLLVPVTSVQNWLNAARNWLEEKIPRIEKIFARLQVPKPIVIVDVTLPEEGTQVEEDEPTTESSDAPKEDVPEELQEPPSGEPTA